MSSNLFLPRNLVANENPDFNKRILFSLKLANQGFYNDAEDHDKSMRLTHVNTLNMDVPHFILPFTFLTNGFLDNNVHKFIDVCVERKLRFNEMMGEFAVNGIMRPISPTNYSSMTDFGKVRRFYANWDHALDLSSFANGNEREKKAVVHQMFYNEDELKEFVLMSHVVNNLNPIQDRRYGSYANRIYERCNFEISLIFKHISLFTLERLPVQSFEI